MALNNAIPTIPPHKRTANQPRRPRLLPAQLLPIRSPSRSARDLPLISREVLVAVHGAGLDLQVVICRG